VTTTSSTNQPGRARPGSVAYENRSTAAEPASDDRSYSSVVKPPCGYAPASGFRSAANVRSRYDCVVPVRPLPYFAWHALSFGFTAPGVVYAFADACDW
jgi:hypothetical protein